MISEAMMGSMIMVATKIYIIEQKMLHIYNDKYCSHKLMGIIIIFNQSKPIIQYSISMVYDSNL